MGREMCVSFLSEGQGGGCLYLAFSSELDGIKSRMIDAGLMAHRFKAKAILEDELLIIVGLHPALDPYEGPVDRFTKFCKYLFFVNIPFLFCIPRSITPHPPKSYSSNFPIGTLVIKVSTLFEPEGTPFQTPYEAQPSSPITLPMEVVYSSTKRPRVEEVHTEVPYPLRATPSLLTFLPQFSRRGWILKQVFST
ncbi:hypothetical protein Salat_0695600 [Sesamum alatum]|uniref:Uncharacterized protein n=1 Tax=Sesamum alatum TaxID=300844 RepID=A0AAE1YSF6_9LAMI|nr:hypothetical protein Salat_0695600 [Sesamum alatum]